MPFKEKISYLWSYYRLQFGGIILAIFIVIQIIGAVYRNMQETLLFCAFINQPQITETNSSIISNSFYELEGFSGWKNIITFDTGMNFDDASVSDASIIKFQSYTNTNTLDTVITTLPVIESLQTEGVWISLSELFTENELALYSDNIIYHTTNDNQQIPIAISLNNSTLSDKIPIMEDSVIAVCSLQNHPEIIKDFISYCFN